MKPAEAKELFRKIHDIEDLLLIANHRLRCLRHTYSLLNLDLDWDEELKKFNENLMSNEAEKPFNMMGGQNRDIDA